jgi:hypothetical protein
MELTLTCTLCLLTGISCTLHRRHLPAWSVWHRMVALKPSLLALSVVILLLTSTIHLSSAGLLFTDSFTDDSKIASSTQSDVTGGQVQLDTYPISLDLANFGSCRKLTIDAGDIDADLTDFPILVHLNSSYIDWSKVQDDLDDLRFTVDNATLLKYEIDSYTTNSEAWIWVKVPAIDDLVNTDLFMYYNNATVTSGQDTENVWDSNYVMVQHLNDATTSTTLDSTSNNNDGTKKGANEPILTTSGNIDSAQTFDGSNDYITAPSDSLPINGDILISFWIKPTDVSGASVEYCFAKGKLNLDGWEVFFRSTGRIDYRTNQAAASQTTTSLTGVVVSGIWNFITIYRTGNAAKIYVNGIDKTSSSGTHITPLNNTRTLKIGVDDSLANPFKGVMDEVRISNSIRSIAWIKASYETQRNHILTIGTEQNTGSAYYTTGSFQSTNLLQGLNVTEIQTFHYNCSLLGSETLQFQFSQDLDHWYNSTQLNQWNDGSTGVHSISLKALGWTGSFFYYRCNLTDGSAATPELYSVSLEYSTMTSLSWMALAFIIGVIALVIGILALVRRR